MLAFVAGAIIWYASASFDFVLKGPDPLSYAYVAAGLFMATGILSLIYDR